MDAMDVTRLASALQQDQTNTAIQMAVLKRSTRCRNRARCRLLPRFPSQPATRRTWVTPSTSRPNGRGTMRSPVPHTALFWGAVVVVFLLALMPMPQWPEAPWSLSDKAEHALVFAGLWLLGRQAYPQVSHHLLAAGILAYGLAMEGAQGLTWWRKAEWADLTADAIGVAAAMTLWRLWAFTRQRVAR